MTKTEYNFKDDNGFVWYVREEIKVNDDGTKILLRTKDYSKVETCFIDNNVIEYKNYSEYEAKN
jgi:hypothetical protein